MSTVLALPRALVRPAHVSRQVVVRAEGPTRPQPPARPSGPSGAPGRGGPGRGGPARGAPGRGGPGRGRFSPGGRGGPGRGAPGRGGPGRGDFGRGTFGRGSGGRGPSGAGRPSPGRGRGRGMPQPVDDGLVTNRSIPYTEVRVLDQAREQLGVMSLDAAIDLATEGKDDVILISEDASPPLVRICSVSKYKYELEKAKKAASKKQRDAQSDLKELKFSPRTDVHDLAVRIKRAKQFLTKGDKVKLVVQFKGREMSTMKDTAMEMLQTVITEVNDVCVVENAPRFAGNQMTAMLGPLKP